MIIKSKIIDFFHFFVNHVLRPAKIIQSQQQKVGVFAKITLEREQCIIILMIAKTVTKNYHKF